MTQAVHELSLCAAIANSVAEYGEPRTVRAVHLRIGHLRQVVPETLAFCWTIHIEGTPLDGCELVVDYVPAEIRCRSCGARTTLNDPLMICGGCDGVDVEVIQGEEFQIQAIDVQAVDQRSAGSEAVTSNEGVC